jgi:hypothetical protein
MSAIRVLAIILEKRAEKGYEVYIVGSAGGFRDTYKYTWLFSGYACLLSEYTF